MEVVQIDKSIKDTFLWNDAQKLRWWLDLLFLAEDGVVDVSIRGLQARWGVGSPNTIRKFISNLSACGYIKVGCITDTRQCTTSVIHPSGGTFTRITICEQGCYEKEKVCQSGVSVIHVSDTPKCNTKPKVTREEQEARFQKAQKEFYDSLRPFVQIYPPQMLREFFNYWSEPNKSKTKMRFEQEKTWDLNRRLARWANNNKDRNNGNTTNDKANYLFNRLATAD